MKIEKVHVNPRLVEKLICSAFKAAGVIYPKVWSKIHEKGNNLERMRKVITRAIKKGIQAERERAEITIRE